MKILYVADLHYSLRQFDWLLANAGFCDVAAIGGDLLDVGGALDPDVQIVVVETPARALITPDYAPGAGVAYRFLTGCPPRCRPSRVWLHLIDPIASREFPACLRHAS